VLFDELDARGVSERDVSQNDIARERVRRSFEGLYLVDWMDSGEATDDRRTVS